MPVGFTGYAGRSPTITELAEWERTNGNGNVAIRMPIDVVGIDIDAYGTKPGGASLRALERECGPLPPTYVSSSRDDGVSGIYWFRCEAGRRWHDKAAGEGIELISWHHRYAIVWPSIHPGDEWTEPGALYRWDGLARSADDIPSVEDLPQLPPAWDAKLAKKEVPAPTTMPEWQAPVGTIGVAPGSPSVSSGPFAPSGPAPWTPESALAECAKWVTQFRGLVDGVDVGYNQKLNDCAVRLGHFVGSVFTAEQAAAALYEAAVFNRSVEWQGAGGVMATIHSGLTAGMREPYSVVDLGPLGQALAVDGTTGGEAGKAAEAAASEDDAVASLRSELLDSDGLDALEDLAPLVEGWLFRDTIASLLGKWSQGKSFVMFDLAAHVGLGIPWHGHDVYQGPVIIIAAEGGRGLKKRKRAWEKHHGRRIENVYVLPRPVQAASLEWFTLVELCRQMKPVLVFIDTQHASTVGMKENEAGDMGLYLSRMQAIQASTEACVVSVHHLGLGDSKEGRGSSSLPAAYYTQLLASKNGMTLTLTNTKQKDDSEAPDLTFECVEVDLGLDGYGREHGSLVLRLPPFGGPRAMAGDAALLTPDKLTGNKLLMIDAIQKWMPDLGGTKAEVTGLCMKKGMPKPSAYRAWNDLVKAGVLVRVKGSAAHRLRGGIGPVDGQGGVLEGGELGVEDDET